MGNATISAIITLPKSHRVSAVTSCHYYPLTLSASDGRYRKIHNNLHKTSGKTLYKTCILSFCHISRSTGKTQSWCWLALKRYSHIAENDQSHDSSPCWWKLLKEVLTLCWKGLLERKSCRIDSFHHTTPCLPRCWYLSKFSFLKIASSWNW